MVGISRPRGFDEHGSIGESLMTSKMANRELMLANKVKPVSMATGGAAPNPNNRFVRVSVGSAFSDGPMAEMRMQGLKKM